MLYYLLNFNFEKILEYMYYLHIKSNISTYSTPLDPNGEYFLEEKIGLWFSFSFHTIIMSELRLDSYTNFLAGWLIDFTLLQRNFLPIQNIYTLFH